MAFDAAAAKAAGYSDEEIAAYQAGQSGVGAALDPPLGERVPVPDQTGPAPRFDTASAKKAGYSDAEIAAYVKAHPETPAGPGTVTAPDGQQYDADNADTLAHIGGMGARVVTQAATALPFMAMDTGVNVRNALTGSNYTPPSTDLNAAMDRYFGKPQGKIEKATDIVGPMLVGAGATKLPGAAGTIFGGGTPELGADLGGTAGELVTLPKQGASADQIKAMRLAAALKRSQDAGFVVPPTTTNPTAVNQALETVGGKIATQQKASIVNQGAANTLAAQANGIGDASLMTPESLQSLRLQAGKAYQAIRNAGSFTTDDDYKQAIDAVKDQALGITKSFPEATPSPAAGVAAQLDVKTIDASHAVDMITRLRDLKSAAYKNSDSASGKMYGDLAKALEDQMDRGLQDRAAVPGSNVSPDMVAGYRAARQKIAIAHSTEDAMDSQGNVSIMALKRAMDRGEPLSGGLRQIAEFGEQFEKAAQPPAKIGSAGINHLEGGLTSLAGGAGALVGEHFGGTAGGAVGLGVGAMLPFARRGAQSMLLSPRGQARGIPEVADMASLNDLGPTRAKAAALAQALSQFESR
jgi:hypothetical protein